MKFSQQDVPLYNEVFLYIYQIFASIYIRMEKSGFWHISGCWLAPHVLFAEADSVQKPHGMSLIPLKMFCIVDCKIHTKMSWIPITWNGMLCVRNSHGFLCGKHLCIFCTKILDGDGAVGYLRLDSIDSPHSVRMLRLLRFKSAVKIHSELLQISEYSALPLPAKCAAILP